MSPWMEFEEKTVAKAIEKACLELNIEKDKIKHDVISYGSSGIFGLVGAKKAKIRVDVPGEEPVVPEKKTGGTEVGAIAAEVPATAASAGEQRETKVLQAEPLEEKTEAPAQDAPLREVHDEDGGKTTENDNPLSLGEAMLQRIVDFITHSAKVVGRAENNDLFFTVEGGNAALLIGKRGQTLQAMQYLVEKVVNKQSEGRYRVQVDIEGYVENRKSNLRQLAARMAEKSKRTGKPVTIGQMNAHDRRIVHMSLKEDGQVRTQSMGEGYYRKLVIFPKRGGNKKK